MKKLIILVAIALTNILASAQEGSQIKLYCDKNQSTISYSMHHPLHSWTGESKDITSVILTDKNRNVISKVAVSVKLSSFDSKNANRDSHVIEATEGLKYPTVSFISNSIKQNGNKLMISGILNFHGVSQIISFEAEKNIINNKAEITGSFILKMTQFKIEPPSLMGMATDDDFKMVFKVVY